ncbi:MAG: terpene cyclase/mutase family protein [Pirellulaceae bacterium]|nr:terpene cyclase/mutase family protein [Pirellulaceae bacterium]
MIGQEPALKPSDANLLERIVKNGLRYLETEGQAADGTFTARAGSGLTALAVTAMLRNGLAIDHPAVAKGLKALEGFVQPDGGIYGGGRLKNYETCVAILCLSEANPDGRYNETINRAKAFLVGNQYGGGQTRDPADPWYGGVGYGEGGRPDLSNTGYLIEALKAAEAGPNDPAIQRALLFVSRCQNLDSQQNNTRFAALVKDGGFYYDIPLEDIDPQQSPERFTENGGLRSYGSMTYTGLKSMIFAGLTKDDPRVKAAVEWITNYYATDKNPGMGTAGLYYYYHTFGAALNAAGIDELTDAQGQKHDWRGELIEALARQQQPDGSWANENRRWFENDKNLATSFALMALSYCRPAGTAP